MPNVQVKSEKINRVQVRLPQALMEHVELQTGNKGFYADSSDYIRDLIRKDALRKEPTFFEYLVGAANAPDSDFEELSADDIIAYSKQKYRE